MQEAEHLRGHACGQRKLQEENLLLPFMELTIFQIL